MSAIVVRSEGDRQIVATRRIAASPDAVYRAHTEARLLRQWLLGPDGWTMPVCICEAQPGGCIRYEWQDANGHGFHATGQFEVLDPGRRIVHVERMHLPDPTPDCEVETLFQTDGGGGTLMRMSMTLPDAASRDMMLSSGMEHGMEASYARLEALHASGFDTAG